MPNQILIVDDEPDMELLVRTRFRRQIKEKELQFFFSQNGAQALETLSTEPGIDLVLSDINMPVMDGLTLLAKLKEVGETRRAVIVSAYGDMGNIRTAMNRGAVDFLTKPIEFEDMETTIRKALSIVGQLRAADATKARLAAVEQELGMAARIQQSLLPETFPPFPERHDFELHAEMVPAKEVGGDLFDFSLMDGHRLAFVVGDVSGKGVPAAIFMSMTQTLLRGATRQRLSPGECLEHVNQTLAPNNPRSMFVTLFYGVLDLRTGELEFANGGHNPPYLFSCCGNVRVLPSSGSGVIVGAIEDMRYETERCTLAPGESILVFTDGVTEANNVAEEFYGEERLERFLGGHSSATARQLVSGLQATVREFAGAASQSDDITVLALRYHG
jgi:sigma-B regulation protein RsbU (phosphoserine phosphatase)